MPVRRVLVMSHVYLDPARRGKLRALAARDVEVTVAVPHRWTERALGRVLEASWERRGSLEMFPIPTHRYDDPATARFGDRELHSLLRDKRPDLVQVEEEPASLTAAQVTRAARRSGIPTVVFTAENVQPRRSFLVRRRRRRVLERARGVIVGSEGAGALVGRVRPPDQLPVAVIPQFGVTVPPSPTHGYHEGLAIGYVGRLVPEKGVDTLLQALALIRGERWHLTVVGEGPERERLETLASRERLAARIRWTGALPPESLAGLWPTLDVLVQPSRRVAEWSEPTGEVLMEAMAHEVLAVGSDAGVTPEIIGDAGLVVPAEDAGALATALSTLMSAEVRRPLLKAGRARVMERFSDDAIAGRTVAFWREILA